MRNTLEELRAKALEILASENKSVEINQWGNNVKDLLQELSIYHIELEHQNSALEQSEKELSASRAEYVALFENAPVGYVIIDNERKIQKINRTFLNAYVPAATRDSHVEERCFDEFVCPEYRTSFELFCKILQKPGISVPIELKIFDCFNRPRYVLMTGGERPEETNSYRLTISDISMQKKLEAQLVKEKEKAEENDRQKSLFLTSVSHVLRTPLTTIIGFSEMLADSHGGRNQQLECLNSITSSGKMLMSLTDEILELSILESGAIPLREENMDVGRICDETTTMTQRKIAGKNVLIRHELRDIPILLGDQVRLQQIIFSILDHAAGNATTGSVVIQGSFERDESGENGVLSLDFIGENIFSGESSLEMDIQRRPVSQNCTGLGLYFARQIVNIMNGSLNWIHPLDALRVEIPFKISRTPIPAQRIDDFCASTVREAPRKCLLVDDVVMNLKVLAAMMKKLNYIPTMANSGKEALNLLTQNSFDLVMTDLWMPEMSGEELAVMIRQNPDYDAIPLVAVTADIERERNFDMSFFMKTIIKPVNIIKLQEMLDKLDSKSIIAK